MPVSPQRRAEPSCSRHRSLTLWPLVAATFFMVSGGTYGTEDTVHGAGYARGILIFLITPLVWSIPTALMIGELAGAVPCEGGYYAWVRRGLGRFWGFQEAWLSLTASIFDMAIYPTLFVLYLSRLIPWFGIGNHGWVAGLAVVVACTALNLAGVKVVSTTSLWMFLVLSAPFAVIVILAFFNVGALAHVNATATANANVDLVTGVLICMWNYMGWDNASTVATEVDRPQRTYPRAIFLTVGIVALSYVLPVAALWLTGLPSSAWDTGFWADIAGMLGGPWLRVALAVGGMISGFGMFNALVMSYSRLPLAMAEDGMLPPIFARETRRARAPWVSILVLSTCWALCLGLGFERLVTLDIFVYGGSLLLEFAALVALRLKEPALPRPFRVPGGVAGAVAVGMLPAVALLLSIFHAQRETVLGMSTVNFGLLLMALGVVAYAANQLLRPTGWIPESEGSGA